VGESRRRPRASDRGWEDPAQGTPDAAASGRHRTLGDATHPRVGAAPLGGGRLRRAATIGDTAKRHALLPNTRDDASLRRAWRDMRDDEWDDERWDGIDEDVDYWDEPPRSSNSRLPIPRGSHELAVASGARPLPADSSPGLAAYRGPSRARALTRSVRQRATQPWSLTRLSLTLVALLVALVTGATHAGERSQPLMGFSTDAGTGPAALWPANAVTAKVVALTQGVRTDLYDSTEQYNTYWGAACSAAALAEILNAYAVPNVTIGRMIDELGSKISPSGGLLSYDGFTSVAQAHGLRTDMYTDRPLGMSQMKYLTNALGIPVIVNVRIAYGYYHFFAGGHFLVVTAVDDQGLRIVDSSLYYVKYLPWGVFNSMFTGRSVVIVPKDYVYTLPT
jgi:hypothetical protein